MRRRKEVSILLAALLVIVVPTVLAGYEENIREDIFLVRPDNEFLVDTTVPTYLENEDLTFFACLETDNVPIRLSVLCEDTNEFADVPARRWGDQNCYIGSMNLESLDCSRATVQADYVSDGENLKLSQEIRINKFSNTLNRVVETQFSDGGWETPLDTAYGLLVISRYPEIFAERIRQAVDYLKLNRDEDDKCWPEDGCRISTTANILFLLDQAGFEDLRIQHDGYLYLERSQNYITGQNWTVTLTDHPLNINNTFNTSCVYDYQDDVSTLELGKHPGSVDVGLVPAYGAYLNVVCTENIIVELANEYDETLVTYQGDNFSFTVPQACWTRNNENITCDTRATLMAAATSIDASQRSAARSFLGTLLEDDRTAGKHVEQNWTVINDGLYLYNQLTGHQDVRTSLLFTQNNTGGWTMERDYYDRTYFEIALEDFLRLEVEATDQVTKNIVATGYAVMGLLADGLERDDEPILDAERWVSLHEDETSLNYTDEDLTDAEQAEAFRENVSRILNDTKRNAMAYFVLQNNARPMLLARPRVLIMNQDSVELDIINPTIFDLEGLEYEFADDIANHVEIEAKDFVGAYSFRRVTVSLTSEEAVDEMGYLRVSKDDQEYLRLPIIIESAPKLNITLPEQLTVFGSTAVLPFHVDKSSHQFTCSLEWVSEGISSQRDFNINALNDSATYNFPVRFAVLETENAVYEGEITCTARDVTFRIPFATNILRFSNTPLEVTPTLLSFTDPTQELQVTVENQLDESIEVSASLSADDPYIVLSDSQLNLLPGERRNVTVQVVPAESENYTTSNSIIFSTYGVEDRVLLDADIVHEPETSLGLLWWIIILTVAGLLMGTSGYFAWIHREALKEWYDRRFHKEDIRARVLEQVARLEREEELVAIRNMMRILKLQGLKDVEVRSRLVGEGYTEQDIDDALNAPTEEQEPTDES